jgi:translation initiation factor 1
MPQDICACEDIAREAQKIKIMVEKRRWGKPTTVISGFDEGIDVPDLGKTLKKKLACGGTVKENRIELQGRQKDRAKQVLIKLGYNENQIDVC